MTQEHLIRPPHELVQQWVSLACENEGYETWQDLATQAARWGADQELEACCEWLRNNGLFDFRIGHLRAARRPKPPRLKEQALLAIDVAVADGRLSPDVSNVVRRALEQLDD